MGNETRRPPSLWLQVSSGRGPLECQWAAARTAEAIAGEAAAAQVRCRVLESVDGLQPGTYRSVLLRLEGAAAPQVAAAWCGTVRWIGNLPGGARSGRKNWHVGVAEAPPPAHPDWSPDELRIDVMRASGPGGQHVNRTNTAVRVTHVPTGLTVIAQEERSQHRNRELALARLQAAFARRRKQAERSARRRRQLQHDHLERGNPVRVYAGPDFRRIDADEQRPPGDDAGQG